MVNKPTAAGASPLFVASLQGQSDCVRLLLHAAADPDQPTHDGTSPLVAACQSDVAQVPKLLLRGGAAVVDAGGELSRGALNVLAMSSKHSHAGLAHALEAAVAAAEAKAEAASLVAEDEMEASRDLEMERADSMPTTDDDEIETAVEAVRGRGGPPRPSGGALADDDLSRVPTHEKGLDAHFRQGLDLKASSSDEEGAPSAAAPPPSPEAKAEKGDDDDDDDDDDAPPSPETLAADAALRAAMATSSLDVLRRELEQQNATASTEVLAAARSLRDKLREKARKAAQQQRRLREASLAELRDAHARARAEAADALRAALALQELDSATGADALRAALADVELHVAVLQGHGAEERVRDAHRRLAAFEEEQQVRRMQQTRAEAASLEAEALAAAARAFPGGVAAALLGSPDDGGAFPDEEDEEEVFVMEEGGAEAEAEAEALQLAPTASLEDLERQKQAAVAREDFLEAHRIKQLIAARVPLN